MRAVVQDRFGAPGSLQVLDIDVPTPGPDDVLVRVHAAALNPADWHLLRGDPRVARLFGVGLLRPRRRVAGIDGAGRIEAVGDRVTSWRPGDEVFGFLKGSFAEFALADPRRIARRPVELGHLEAAVLPIAATTALRAIRDVAAVEADQRVLINGAAGGVGSFAVQVAAGLGAEVTGVCSPSNIELVRSLGAAHVVDHTTTDVTTTGPYDVVLDNVGNHPARRMRRVLTPAGTLVVNGGGSPGKVFGAVGTFLGATVLNTVVPQRLVPLATKEHTADLDDVARMVVDGRLAPVIDRTYPLAEVADGLGVIESGRGRGKFVVQV